MSGHVPVRIVVCGAKGRMGRRVIELALLDSEVRVTAGVERKELSGKMEGIDIADNLASVVDECDVVVDFTAPASAAEHAEVCAASGKAYLTGTTGIGPQEMAKIEKAAARCAVLVSPNMSWGMNVLTAAAAGLAARLGRDYDIEIIEKHHREKKDSPSGTALQIAKEICTARGWEFPAVLKYGREGKPGKRPEAELGVHSVRGGTIIGEHEIIFAGTGERITISHTAESRDCFAAGALKAAKLLSRMKPGLYTMQSME